jgi:hypothetical protein
MDISKRALDMHSVCSRLNRRRYTLAKKKIKKWKENVLDNYDGGVILMLMQRVC